MMFTPDLTEIPKECPVCKADPFITFMRGAVGRSKRPWYWPFIIRNQYSIICRGCKRIVGHEENRVIDITGMSHLELTVGERKLILNTEEDPE